MPGASMIASRPQRSAPVTRMRRMNLARIAWLVTVLACLVTAVLLVFDRYYGYAGVALAVGVSAAINLR
jgi:hypothetical protein